MKTLKEIKTLDGFQITGLFLGLLAVKKEEIVIALIAMLFLFLPQLGYLIKKS